MTDRETVTAEPDPATGEEWVIAHINAIENTLDTMWELLTAIGQALSARFNDHLAGHPAARKREGL